MVDTNFPLADKWTSAYEGGYSNNPSDPGGPTQKGVTQKVYDAYRRKKGLAPRPVRQLEEAERLDIYLNGYWLAVPCGPLPSGVDCFAYDVAVNSGTGRIRPWLLATTSLTPVPRVKALASKRRAFFQSLKTLFVSFGKGWISRCNDLEVKCLRLALQSENAAAQDKQTLFQNEAQSSIVAKKNHLKAAQSTGTGGVTTGSAGGLAHSSQDPAPAVAAIKTIPIEMLVGGSLVLIAAAIAFYVAYAIHKDRASRMVAAAVSEGADGS